MRAIITVDRDQLEKLPAEELCRIAVLLQVRSAASKQTASGERRSDRWGLRRPCRAGARLP